MTDTAAPVDIPAIQQSRLMRQTWIEPSPRHVRAVAGGITVVDSRRALLVFEAGRPTGTYWFPVGDVRMDLMTERESNAGSPVRRWSMRAGDREIANAARGLASPDEAHAQLRDHVTMYWKEMDAWYEEDDEIFVEPRDPYHRVDVLHSSRHVRVEVDGQTVAETRRPRLLFETLLPVRYYIPKLDVRMDLLVPSATTTRCPYKGVATYWSLRLGETVHRDLVWSYPAPIPECSKIENLLCFYNEKVDTHVDGELLPRPVVPG